MSRIPPFLTGFLVAALLISGNVLSGQANASPHHEPMGPKEEQLYNSLTPEKQAIFDTIMDDFMQETAALRDKISAKRLVLQTLGNAPNPNVEVINRTAEELVALRNELAPKRKAMQDRIAEETGLILGKIGKPRPERIYPPVSRYGCGYPPMRHWHHGENY